MEIVIYDCRTPYIPASTEAVSAVLPVFSPRIKNSSIARLSRSLGYNLLILSLASGFIAISPLALKQAQYWFGPKLAETPVKATFGQIIRNEDISKRSLAAAEAKQYGVQTDFSIVIPKINAKAKVVPNIHPGDKEEYTAALKQGVAHASGSFFPGQNKTVFLFSHSTNTEANIERYNAVFYLLKELEAQDNIIVFYAGQKYNYQVMEKKVIEAEDTSLLIDNSEEEKLVLQTCWPPGTSLKRLVVIAKPI